MTATALADVVEIVMGQAPPGNACKRDGVGTPFVKAGEFQDRRPVIREWTTKPLRMAQHDDTLVCVVGATAGKVNQGADCAIGRSVAAVRPRKDSIDPEFLYRFLSTTVARLRGGSQGAAQGVITREMIGSLTLRLPPLPEQRRIAAILDHADALRAKRRQVLAHLDSLTQSVFAEMFSEGAFPLERAGALMPDMRNGLSPATAGTHQAQVLTLSAVTQGPFDPSSVKAGVFAVEPPADKRITDRDFLMCRGNGNKALVGVGTYSKENRPDLVFPDTVIAGTVDTAMVRLPFLEAAWKRREVRAQIEAVARTTNGTYKVNQKTLAGVMVPVPPLDLQDAFATRVARVGEQVRAVRRAAESDDELFASLESHAFRGEL
ncbi:restriction endonuclease subunit S [Nocardioides sp. Kera G14]|uniref:restriction endonuclease subunit S n=1 Tax=Nocardioides sp. Kera G14 TaxID=2884264 RepID=UPI001D130508|nr:restriction endonuclease subunit S [Nocardioides sp. Kera G14]UDY22938.1 restriction endonuclease subunit S [Nocardioides sp. Kera G14]